MKPRIQKIIFEGQTYRWFVRDQSEYGYLSLQIWAQLELEAIRPLQVQLWHSYRERGSDGVWMQPRAVAELAGLPLEFRFLTVTPAMVRQVIEAALLVGWHQTRGSTPLRFEWNIDAQPADRLISHARVLRFSESSSTRSVRRGVKAVLTKS
jgi:hypothetical protein